MTTDWRGEKSVTGCLEALCLTETMADVTFSFKESDERVHAHKFVLSLRSEVFEKMFYGPMAEQRQEIRIVDTDPESFKLFLKYVYSDATADFNGSTVMGYLHLGRKYQVDSLVRACVLYLEKNFSDNVCTILEQTEQYMIPELQEKCLLYMADHAENVFKSEEFLSISCKSLAQFFARDEINVKEECVFEAAVQWAKRQCANSGEDESPANLRRYLGDAIYRIRLSTIPINTFADVIGASGLLSKDEELHLYRYIASSPNDTNAVSEIVGKFPTDKRKPSFATIVLRNDSKHNAWNSDETKHISMTIVSSMPLKLLSVSGDIIALGIRSVHLNKNALVEDAQWQVRNQTLEMIDGMLLKKNVKNVLTFDMECEIHVDDDDEAEQSFDVLGAKGYIKYPNCYDCKLDCVVLSK